MSSKLLLLIMSTFLLVQSSCGKATSTTAEPELSVLPEETGIELLMFAMAEFSKLADVILITGKKVFQDVIADVSAQDIKNEEITARLDEYSKLVSKIETLQAGDDSDEFTHRFELTVELRDLWDKANATLIEKPSSVDKLFDESFKKNGLNNLEQELEAKFKIFAKSFNETTDRVLKSVTIEEWPQKTKIEAWLNDFNRENDVEKKIKQFVKFFEFFK